MTDSSGQISIGIRRLTELVSSLQQSLPWSKQPQEILPRLHQFLASFAELPILPAVLRPNQAVISRWCRSLGDSQKPILTKKELISLCWHPQVAMSREFLVFVANEGALTQTSQIMGLLYSYHSQYRELRSGANGEDAVEGDLISLLSSIVLNCPARSRFLAVWKQNLTLILSIDDRELFGNLLQTTESKVTEIARAFGVYPATSFISRSIYSAIDSLEKAAQRLAYPKAVYLVQELLDSPYLERTDWEEAVALLFNSQRVRTNKYLRRSLLSYVPGDPTLDKSDSVPGKQQRSLPTSAQQGMVKMLAWEDIDYFFEYFAERGEDWQGRREFWMSYVNGIVRTRVLVGENLDDPGLNDPGGDELSKLTRRKGVIRGAQSSAIVMDFDDVVFLELSPSYECCYVYTKKAFSRVLKDFWNESPFLHNLKDDTQAMEKVSRSLITWKDEIGQILLRNGHRPQKT